MADNNDIKDFLEEAKAGKVPENAMDAQLEFLVGSGLDYDVETLRSLAGVVKGLPDDNKYKADLAKKIEEKLKSLENDANQPTGDKPNYDEKTSYNLKKEFEKALQEKDVETAKGIATYALDYVKRSQLTEKNAPTISDYYDILKKANVEIPEENLKKLEAALKAYDAQNNLADMKLSAEEYEANAEEWKKLMSKSKLLGEAVPKFLPEDADEKLKKETFEAVQSAAITQLALKKPDENSEAAIKEKLAELLAVQAQTREFVIADIYNQHKEEINKAYLDFIGMNNEEFNKKFNEADAEQKKEILQKMQQFRNHYIEQHYDVNTVLNARLHERNATMASRIAQKTNAVQTPEHVNHPLKNFVKANPKIMKGIKDAAISMGVFATAGVAGITALSVYKFGEATLDSYRRFKGIDTSQRKGLLNKIKGAKDDALDLIKNFKEFKAYIKNNPDERLALKKAGVTAVLSVGLAGFGAANGVLNNGIVGNMLTEGGKDLAAQASFVALRRAVLLGAGGLFAGQTVVLKNRQIAPKKAEMLAILARYTDANTPQGKGLLGKFFKPKSPAEAIYGKLTGMFASKEDPKLEAKLDALVPNLRPQDKARLMELSKEIIDMSRAKGIAVGGVGLGVAAAELSDHGGSHDAAQATPAPETPTA
ncbi:MAG: hypothetical protein J6Y91_01955, partial [Alphaproteobacteria bacterium]|nr:hypothetical protein [Alphaproteobacteria bacterium]